MAGQERLRIALAQVDLLVGAVPANVERLIDLARRARAELGADVVMFPELALSGYPPEDLLFHRGLRLKIEEGLDELRRAVPEIAILTGYPEYHEGRIYNAALLLYGGQVLANHRKACLPNYRVFDEKRYFSPGSEPTVVDFRGYRLGLLICEDSWERAPARAARQQGAEALLIVNASPFEMDAQGRLVVRAAPFEESLACVELRRAGAIVEPVAGEIAPELSDEASVYRALVLGVRDYVDKHRFPGVIVGLSGGVDSALTLAVAVDALGAERVHAVMMPSRYTSAMSREDASAQAHALGVRLSSISIEGMFEATLQALRDEFAGLPADTTEENIQARCRGVLLMAISNKTGRMLLTTGNKSEMAVGYATLYGDMAGGFAPIKDCGKLLVYRLARYRNGLSPVIPPRVIERAPTAELRPDQKDTDSLPPYEVLDPILEAFIEEDLSVDEICERGFERAVVARVLEMVRRAEYKRRQAPPGVRVSRRAFGRDWRYPITNGYRR